MRCLKLFYVKINDILSRVRKKISSGKKKINLEHTKEDSVRFVWREWKIKQVPNTIMN